MIQISATECERHIARITRDPRERSILKEYSLTNIFMARIERDALEVCSDVLICCRVELNRCLKDLVKKNT